MRYIVLLLILILTTTIWAQDTERDVSPIPLLRSEASEGVDYLPIVHDEDLSLVADYIAEEILAYEDFTSEDVEQILTDSGYRLTDYGLAWGTTFDDFDTVVATITNRYSDMILNETTTHFALGFASEPDINAYVFLAVTFNTCEPLNDEDFLAQQIEQEETFLDILNTARAEEGLALLSLDIDMLYQAAQWYSNDMLKFGYPTKRAGGIPHIGTDGSQADERVEREGYSALIVRENILSRWTLSAEGAFDQWWNSPSHKENMMAEDVSVMALAIACNVDTGEYYYTQVLAEPFFAVASDTLITSLQAQINNERATFGQLPLDTDPALMTYADELAGYIYENNRFPTRLWEELESRYTYRTAYATSAGTTGDTIETLRYLMDAYADDLLSGDYSEIGIGIYYDTDTNFYWHVLILADPA